jgi:hypothetical protein
MFFISAVCLFHFVLWADYFRDFQKENVFFSEELFPPQFKDKKMAGLMFDVLYRGEPVYMHFQNYYIIWKKGIATSSILDYRFGTVIRRKVSERELPQYIEWVGLTQEKYNKKFILDNIRRYANMDYILVRRKDEMVPLQYYENFTIREKKGSWALYEKKNN